MTRPASSRRRESALLLLLLGSLLVFMFKQIGAEFFDDFLFDLGSAGLPRPIYMAFVGLWTCFGLGAAAAFTAGLVQLTQRDRWPPRPLLWLFDASDTAWLIASATMALLVPVAIRTLVLDGAPLADDESSYLFSAKLLASGRLWVESPPEKLFFDRSFMINNGRFYSQYFLGWPALFAPFAKLGIPGLANPVLSALTAPGVFLVLRRLAGPAGARLGAVLYLSSPFLMIGAATQLSHTSCFAALVWLTWAVLRSRDQEAPLFIHSLVALSFCTAFFVRPLTAVAIGAPLLFWWAVSVWKLDHRRGRAVAAVLVPAASMAALFLAVNLVQNGSALTSAYQAALDYARENGFRFTHWNATTTMSVPLDLGRAKIGVANAGVALFRLNAAMFGWPASLLLIPLAWRVRSSTPFWVMLPIFLLSHLTLLNIGIDSFGPVHYFELTWPVIILTVIGIERLRSALLARFPASTSGGPAWHAAPRIGFFVLVALASLCYLPARLTAVHRISYAVNQALEAPQRAGLRNALVFAPRYLSRGCDILPNHFVFWRPNPDPDFEDSVIWANHITVEDDRRLMKHFADRTGYVFVWAESCVPALLPLAELEEGDIPPGPM